MRLYLVRHGDAVAAEVDAERPLSPRGMDQARRTAALLCEIGAAPVAIEHSPKARARQTAEIVAAALGKRAALAVNDGINPDDDPTPVAQAIARRSGDLILVGHLPFLPRLAQQLLGAGAPSGIASLGPAGVLILDHDGQAWRFVQRLTLDH